MDESRLKLTAQIIYNKDFKQNTMGYDTGEVDTFLDKVIEDYQEFEKILKEKEAEKTALFDQIINLKQENRDLKMMLELHQEEKKEEVKDVSNLDLLRRLARLEKIIYGKDNK